MVKKVALIVAGGKGIRMGSDMPKQFIEVAGLPILMHTIKQFYDFDNNIEIIIVLPTEQISKWQELCSKYKFEIKHKIVIGGAERFHSVQNGLQAIDNRNSLVAIHDGVRPLVSQTTLTNCFASVKQGQGVVPVIAVTDSLRAVDSDGNSQHVDRSTYRAVQTPQVFCYEDIIKAYNVEYRKTFTDDASVFEANNGKIILVKGNNENIKITTPQDLFFMEAYINKRK